MTRSNKLIVYFLTLAVSFALLWFAENTILYTLAMIWIFSNFAINFRKWIDAP